MITEEQLIYTIWDIVRAGEHNQDDPMNERLMRRFLQIHRGKHLFKFHREGEELPDEIFQNLGPYSFNEVDGIYRSPILPKTIHLKGFGYQASINGFPISVVEEEEYRTQKTDRWNQYQPMIKFVDNRMFLRNGKKKTAYLDNGIRENEHNAIIELLTPDVVQKQVKVDIKAVLVDPDDQPGYDFTTSPYPFPNEYIEDLINSVNAREFNLFLRMPSDEIGDSRHHVEN